MGGHSDRTLEQIVDPAVTGQSASGLAATETMSASRLLLVNGCSTDTNVRQTDWTARRIATATRSDELSSLVPRDECARKLRSEVQQSLQDELVIHWPDSYGDVTFCLRLITV